MMSVLLLLLITSNLIVQVTHASNSGYINAGFTQQLPPYPNGDVASNNERTNLLFSPIESGPNFLASQSATDSS